MFLYLVVKKFQYNNSTQINNNKKKWRFSVQALLIMSVRETRLFGRINKTLLFPHLQQVPVTFIWFSLAGRESQFASCFFLYWEERGKESSWTTSHQLPWQPTIPNNPWKKFVCSHHTHRSTLSAMVWGQRQILFTAQILARAHSNTQANCTETIYPLHYKKNLQAALSAHPV